MNRWKTDSASDAHRIQFAVNRGNHKYAAYASGDYITTTMPKNKFVKILQKLDLDWKTYQVYE